MIGKNTAVAINEQINKEMYSAYLYLAMSAWCASQGFPGAARWLKIQFEEEMEHADKFFDYMITRGARVELAEIKAPKAEFKSVKSLFDEVLKHEQFVTQSIYTIVETAQKEKDHASVSFLQWFVNEQVEEESHAQEIVDFLAKIGDSTQGLMILDGKLGKRKED